MEFPGWKACVQCFSLLKTGDSIEFLILALTDEDPDIRVSSALSLGRIGGEGVFEPLSLVLSDSDDSVRGAVAKAFGILRDKRAVGPLISLLSDKNGLVVTASIESLGKIEGEEARSSLLKMLPSSDREIRRTAIEALSSFEDIEDALVPFLRDDDWATRMVVVEVLGKRAKGFIRNELERLLDTEEDPIVLKAVEESLKKGI